MILDMRSDFTNEEQSQATVIVNASLGKILHEYLDCDNVQIISFDSFTDDSVCSAGKIKEFLGKRESICPKLEIIDLSRACSPDADLESEEAKRFQRFVKALKENTDIDIVATPELEKLFPILLQEKEDEEDKLSKAYTIPLKEQKYSAMKAITKIQLAQAEDKLSPELYRDILEHSNNYVVTQRIISAIDEQLAKGTEKLEKYIPTLAGCIAERIITSDNFDAIVDIAEKYVPQDDITIEDVDFCFMLQEESSQSEESYQRINNLIKSLIPLLPEEVRQDLDEKAALKEKKQQEYIQKRQKLQARVNEYSDYLLLSDAIYKDVSAEHIRKIGDTIYENAEKYEPLYTKILNKIAEEGDEYKLKAAARWIEPIILQIDALHWIEPIILQIDAPGLTDSNKRLLDFLRHVVTKNQDVRHEYGHIFCQQLKTGNNSEFWMTQVKALLNKNKNDHILLMNTYEDMEQAYKARPELIAESLDIFKETLKYPEIEKGFNDHLHTLASIVGDTARDYPEFTGTAMEILSTLTDIEKKLDNSSAKSYLHSKIDEAFEKIKQNDLSADLKRDLTLIHEKDPEIFANTVKELMNDPQTVQQHIERAIEMRINSGLEVLIDDCETAEHLKWNLAVLQSEPLQNKGPEEISACAEKIFNSGVLKHLKDNPNYDPSETLKAIYDAEPYWLSKLREKLSDKEDLLMLEAFDRIPKEIQKLYIGEYTGKTDNLIKTDRLKDFPEIAAQKLKDEVCSYAFDISSDKTYSEERSLSGMEEAAAFLKEINGYSSPEVCTIALYEAMRIRASVSSADSYSGEMAYTHFYKTKGDIKQYVKISNDIIDNVFEQIRQQKDNSALTDILRVSLFYGLSEKAPLTELMGKEAAEAFLSGDENYKKLWDKKMANDATSAYLMSEKPHEILKDLPIKERVSLLYKIRDNTYTGYTYYGREWKWKDFPELLSSEQLWPLVSRCSDCSDKDVVDAVKTFCKARIDPKTSTKDAFVLKLMMSVYDAEAQKGIEDKELFTYLYKARFGKNSKSMHELMTTISYSLDLTSPKIRELCDISYGLNRLKLKINTKEIN